MNLHPPLLPPINQILTIHLTIYQPLLPTINIYKSLSQKMFPTPRCIQATSIGGTMEAAGLLASYGGRGETPGIFGKSVWNLCDFIVGQKLVDSHFPSDPFPSIHFHYPMFTFQVSVMSVGESGNAMLVGGWVTSIFSMSNGHVISCIDCHQDGLSLCMIVWLDDFMLAKLLFQVWLKNSWQRLCCCCCSHRTCPHHSTFWMIQWRQGWPMAWDCRLKSSRGPPAFPSQLGLCRTVMCIYRASTTSADSGGRHACTTP